MRVVMNVAKSWWFGVQRGLAKLPFLSVVNKAKR